MTWIIKCPDCGDGDHLFVQESVYAFTPIFGVIDNQKILDIGDAEIEWDTATVTGYICSTCGWEGLEGALLKQNDIVDWALNP